MALGGSLVSPGFLARLWEKLHRWSLRRATRVLVLGDDMRRRIISKGIDPARVVVVRDGTDLPPQGVLQSLDPQVIQSIRGDSRFVLLHAGNLGFYGAWDTLLTAARELAQDGISLVFVGDGAERERLQSAAAGLSNVRFLPFFPSGKIPSVLAAADAHIITVKRGLEGVVVPSKLYGILAAGKPVVTVAPSECDVVSIGTRKGFSIATDPDDPARLVQAIRGLSGNADLLRSMGAAAIATAPEYARSKELAKLVELVHAATQP